jgi:hypothetical protein
MAAVFRVAARLGWNEQIGNHNSLMLAPSGPGERPTFLINPRGSCISSPPCPPGVPYARCPTPRAAIGTALGAKKWMLGCISMRGVAFLIVKSLITQPDWLLIRRRENRENRDACHAIKSGISFVISVQWSPGTPVD